MDTECWKFGNLEIWKAQLGTHKIKKVYTLKKKHWIKTLS